MRVLPISQNEFSVMPETETEFFYVQQFLMAWYGGNAKLVLRSGLMGINSQIVLELRPQNNLIPASSIIKEPKKK